MLRFTSLLLTLFMLMHLSGCWAEDVESPQSDASVFEAGTGIVAYSGYSPLSSRPIKVHYNIPASGDMATMPVLFVFPGLERNAGDYLNSWKSASSLRKFMVFVLEFPADTYSSSQYIEGGMFQNGKPVDRSQWTFSLVESLFDFIKKETGSRLEKYDMWGHSAGAQFVHRYATFMTEARMNRVVSANAGWYTVPDTEIAYPYGLKDSGMADALTLRHLFSLDMIVELGTADTSRDGLNVTAGAEAQGSTRFERGTNYFNRAEKIAADGSYAFNWTKREVAGVAHDHAKMAEYAAQMLY